VATQWKLLTEVSCRQTVVHIMNSFVLLLFTSQFKKILINTGLYQGFRRRFINLKILKYRKGKERGCIDRHSIWINFFQFFYHILLLFRGKDVPLVYFLWVNCRSPPFGGEGEDVAKFLKEFLIAIIDIIHIFSMCVIVKIIFKLYYIIYLNYIYILHYIQTTLHYIQTIL